nr:unnamed protein product [Amyelois transitella]
MSKVDPDIPINLGQKRKLYNECVQYWINTDTPIISEYILGEDVDKLMKIDIACAKQDVPFVLKALTDEDILYVSRTIKQSTWIITDKNYANIINPEYLKTELLPKMTVKAASKLMKYIRLHLKDETRAESFYKSEKSIEYASKWLPYCSVRFIEKELVKPGHNIGTNLFKRLSEKSTRLWKILIRHKDLIPLKREAFQSTLFILYKDTDQFLDIIEESESYEISGLGIKGTQIIMKRNYHRVLDKLSVYLNIIDLPTFAKCLQTVEVIDVLYKIVEECSKNNYRYYIKHNIFNFSSMRCFIQQMPIDDQYKFVKEVFIDKIHENKTSDEVGVNNMAKLYSMCKPHIDNDYVWYQFATFEEAFVAITERIQKETRQFERTSMLKTLLDCAKSNTKNIIEVLKHFFDKHINDKLIDKEDFVVHILISKKPIHKYDKNTWAILHEIFEKMDVYKEQREVSDNIIEAIIVYNSIHDIEIPKMIENKFVFNTLKNYEIQMNQYDKDKLFTYLYNYNITKLETCSSEDQQKFKERVDMVYNILKTLKDWKKNITDYPLVLDKIRECIQIRSKNKWNTNLSKLYNIHKSWKKYMFEESMKLNPSEQVCLNALKHDAGLLKRNETEILKLSRNDKVSLCRLLNKIKIFWCNTLAKEWGDEYKNRIKENDGSPAVVRGLCAVLPRNQLIDIIKEYAPKRPEINWTETDNFQVFFQRNLAKNMHISRPQPSPDSILLYAKGDYLQYALPSVLAIFYNLSPIKTREYIPRLFDAPVSLQKHGLRLAVTKIPLENIIDIFNNTWRTTKNVTIRAVIFKLTFTLLSKETDTGKVNQLWDFLKTIIDNLSFEEDSNVYELLGEAEDIPVTVRAQFVEKSYIILKKILQSKSVDDRKHIENIIKSNLMAAEKIMDQICPNFMTKLLLEYIEELNVMSTEKILHKNMKIKLLAKFLLVSNTEGEQIEKFNAVCKPFIKCSQMSCHKTLIPRLQLFLRQNLVNVIEAGMVFPDVMFSQLHTESSAILSIAENYIILTEMKLYTALFKILKDTEKGDLNKMINQAACEFGITCVNYLREDIDKHFPLIHSLFAKALNNVYQSFKSIENKQCQKQFVQ